MSFAELIDKTAPIEDIAQHLDALAPADRVREVREIGRRLQTKLWDLAKGRHALSVQRFVDAPDQTVIYEGKNTVPVFSFFQKRFFRPKDGPVVGYNHNGGFVTGLVGPGYFLTEDSADGEILFDYTRLPSLQPPEWPAIKPNTGFAAGLVYGGMKDYIRWVSDTTVIGAAFIAGKPRNQYFLLTRAAAS